jgi:6-phosphogluconolactonase (cycloisomerase 2 family)
MRVLKRRVERKLGFSLVLAIGGLGALVLPGSALAAGGSAGHVYLDDNTAGANTIAGFDRNADGSLTALPGSPFAAGGAGAGQGLASQGAIQLADGGRYVLAVDAGSNQISVLEQLATGSLRRVEGSPVSSGGILPVSIAVHGNLVYVANAGAGGSNYTGFTLSPGGKLQPIPGSTVALPDNAQPGDVLFNGDGTKLVGTRVGSSQIDSFTVGQDGRLTAAPGSPYTAQGLGPFGSEFRPTNPDQLFVSNAHNGAGLGTVSAYNDAANGALSPIGSSPFADQQTAPCWVIVTPDGQFLFAVNTGSGTISRYSIAQDGTLALIGSTSVSSTGGVGAVDPGITRDGRTLYINESRIARVGEFAVNGGNLTELASSPVALPAGATPAGIAVN